MLHTHFLVGSAVIVSHQKWKSKIPLLQLECFCFSFPAHKKRGKVEEVQRKVGVVLLNGQKLELSCDIKAVCKDVLDMVVAHIGLVEHHLFGLAYLRGIVCCSCPCL